MSSSAIVGLDGLVEPSATVDRLATGAGWAEGIAYIAESRTVRWSDIHGNRILQYSLDTQQQSTYQDDVEFTNGRTIDLDGSVVQCSHGNRRIERDVGGVVTPIVTHWNGARFNSPNDVIVASDGAVWFTDPHYGITVAEEGHPGELEYGDCYVFRFDPIVNTVEPVIMDIEEPNGLAFSPDESILYVSDSSHARQPEGVGNHHIRSYDVRAGRCKNGRVFAEIAPGLSDGFRVDDDGNVWTSAMDGVHVLDPDGVELGRILVPETVANLCWGGDEGTELFLAATTSVYRVRTLTRQSPRPGR